MMLKLRMRMPIMAAPRVWADICKRHQGASVPNEGFATATFQKVPDRVEPQSLIRCSEVEGIARR
jgi:hypothetical protein